MNSLDAWKQEFALIKDDTQDWSDQQKSITYLKSLITTTASTHLLHLKAQSEHYEQVSEFKRDFNHLKTFILKFQKFTNETCKPEMIKVSELSSAFYNKIVEYKSTLTKPQLKHIEYTEHTDLNSIKPTHSKRVLLSDTIKAAKTALAMAEPQMDAPLDSYVSPLYCCIMTLSVLKIMLWNPLEWIYSGHVTSNSPIRSLMNDYMDTNKHMQAVQKYSRQILNCELITKDVASGFAMLAPYATTLDLKKTIFRNEKVPLDKHQPQIDPGTLDCLIKHAFDSRICNVIHLSKNLHESDYIQQTLSLYTFKETDDHEHFKTYTRHQFL